MNTFQYLPLEEEKTQDITSENRYRNCKKSLTQKKERYESNPSEELKEKIDILQSAVSEWEILKLPIKKKSKKKKKKLCKKEEDDKILNDSIKINKKILNDMTQKKKQIESLWNKPRRTAFPLWKYRDNLIFPKELTMMIMCLFMMNRRDDNYFAIIPKDVLINMLEQNIGWYDYSEKNTVSYKQKKVNCYNILCKKKRNKKKRW